MSRFQPPPASTGTELGRYLQGIASFLNVLPVFSVFSYSSPNSNVTAATPTLGINMSSSGSKLWAKTIGSGSTGWVAIA